MISQKQISDKLLQLDIIKEELKQEFFGIDTVIDRVVESITSWYVLPEVIRSPVIVNLWGLTGVGKTALVRRLVKKLGFKRRFVEIQMDSRSSGSGYWADSVSKVLQSSSIEEGEPGVLLLDEFQRFRTVDRNGVEQKVERFQDVWTLLSDGKFSIDCELFSLIDDHLNQEQFYADRGRDEDDGEDDDGDSATTSNATPKKNRKFKIYPYEAKSLKKLLGSKESVLEIMSWDKEKVTEKLQNRVEKEDPEELNFTKLLVFICGNLDEVFTVADSTDDADTDADTFYNYTKKLTLFDVKRELLQRFKPEQIARFGNNHVVYPSLNRAAYERIISTTCGHYVQDAEQETGVGLFLNDSFLKEVYNNSVYPTQGTRPVLSSINQIMGQSVPKICLWALSNGYNPATLDINSQDATVVANFEDKVFSVPVYLDVNEAKDKTSEDVKAMVAVHEAGHAVVFSLLTNIAPLQVKINVLSFSSGFNYIDNKIHSNYESELKFIQCNLAGTVAEELVFGETARSIGCETDVVNATKKAAGLVRCYGFHNQFQSYVVPETQDSAFELNTDLMATNKHVEQIVAAQKQAVKLLLMKNMEFLRTVVDQLLLHTDLNSEKFIEIATPFVPNIHRNKTDVLYNYAEKWNTFKAKA